MATMKSIKKSNYMCCVPGCSNTYKKSSEIRLFSFPNKNKDPTRLDKWITAVRRINADGSKWLPSKYSKICSEHFISGEPIYHPTNPDYVPCIFPKIYLRPRPTMGAVNRHDRAMKRSNLKAKKNMKVNHNIENENLQHENIENNLQVVIEESMKESMDESEEIQTIQLTKEISTTTEDLQFQDETTQLIFICEHDGLNIATMACIPSSITSI